MRRVGEWYQKTWIMDSAAYQGKGGGLRFCLVICHIFLVGVLFYIVGHDLFVRFFLIFFNVEIIFVSLVAYWTRAATPWRCQANQVSQSFDHVHIDLKRQWLTCCLKGSTLLHGFERFAIMPDIHSDKTGKRQVTAMISGTVDERNPEVYIGGFSIQLVILSYFFNSSTHEHQKEPGLFWLVVEII